ncbi:hypothetical protein GUITHDRAFT_99801 [Guillardia theta CCMP2712]|uniref:Adenylyl cyclase-associated protein n=1 Tax=Guillardia theta (strain CCMP2712) TaxID=905079 RepID=L1K1A5_GUITC|nr:hypothetical protein GUITHDRAFT_99801 [Guillardia theta CCMP2712]EKX54324.1 hypothetical protein GUITHDRAFT_99801 [Guillardia theta CCMP2712]|eukprot:XP_005841304.1 hypothetical protein GUITHDRAFT_99801 [Guillardia theta CCMP2712]
MNGSEAISRLEAVAARLEAIESRMRSVGVGPGASAGQEAAPQEDAPFVKAFDELIHTHFAPIETAAKSFEKDVEGVITAFRGAINEQRKFLVIASKCVKPNANDMQKVLAPVSEAMSKVDSLKDRRSSRFNHLAMVAEGAACLGWIAIDLPAPYLGDVIPASEMYGNKIMMEFRGKDENHVNFAKSFKQFLLELQKYVKAHHTTGVAWNPRGGTDYTAGSEPAKAASTASGFFDDVAKPASSGPSAHAALFAEINAKGEGGVTKGLKKVSKDQMTHKNPALRASSVVADKEKSSSTISRAEPAKKPPKMEKNGAKWFIENMENNRDLKIDDASTKTSVCMAQCKGSLLQIPGKINTVQMDGCTKTSMVVDSCVASVDVINCKSCEIQILDWTPMITIDGCAGVIVYLSQRCVDEDVAIVTSKCSELNIVLPAKVQSDAEDPTELPIPEQYETRIRNGQLVTTCVAHVGA